MKIAFVGASGYGNVGDDTYPLVFREQLRGHDLVFYNSDLPAALPDDIALLVIGGGGVLHNVGAQPENSASPHFSCMKFYMDAAIERGIPWGFISCGFQFHAHREAEFASDLRPWEPYLQSAHFVTLRSPACLRIAREISGRSDVAWFPDAGYLYSPELLPAENVITIVPAGAVNATDPIIHHYIRLFDSIQQPIKWLSMGARRDDSPILEKVRQRLPHHHIVERSDARSAFSQIARSRLVITGRYHGLVFARTARVPFLTPTSNPHKIRHEDLSVDPTTAKGHIETLKRFLPA